MQHLKEFNFFSSSKGDKEPRNSFEDFFIQNWNWVKELFLKESIVALNYDVVSPSLFMIEFDPPNDEMPKDISDLVETIKSSLSSKLEEPSLDWRFSVGDPFILRFFTRKHFLEL